MSVLRSVVRPVRTATVPAIAQRRLASHDTHHHDHHESHDTSEYPKEGFSGPLWRNVALFTVGFVGLVKFMPENNSAWTDIDDAPWLTRVLAYYAPSLEEWKAINDKNVEVAERFSSGMRLQQSAKKEAVIRYRYPLLFEQVSSHRVPVGGMTDLSDLVVKS